MDLVMEDNTNYVTILRNPVTQFESSFFYFEFDRVLRLRHHPDPIRLFMEYPDEYLYNITLVINDFPETINLLQSGMFYDLGQDFLKVEEDDVIRKRITEMESEFGLIMIMEYFDESLVLLKIEMCWQLEDILYIKQNQRKKTNSRRMSDDLRERILQWNRADSMLYNHFNRTLWNKINALGDTFWHQLRQFRAMNREIRRVCAPRKITLKGFRINVNVTEYVMDPKVEPFHRYLCQKILTTEIGYLTYFRKKLGQQYGYQKILIREGLRPEHHENVLQRRMAKKMRMNTLAKKQRS